MLHALPMLMLPRSPHLAGGRWCAVRQRGWSMSVRVSALVWKALLPKVNGPKGCSPHIEKLVLLKMADVANDDGGSIFPSRDRIAAECHIGKDAVSSAVDQLKSRGILELVHRSSGIHRRAAEYRINLSALRSLVPDGACIENNEPSMERNCHGKVIPTHETPIGRNQPLHETESAACIGRQFRHQPSLESPLEPSCSSKGEGTPDPSSKVPKAVETKGARLPDDWCPAEATRATLRDEGASVDLLRSEFRKFVDYWRSQPGAKARKADWDATFRNWVRRELENSQRRPNASAGHRGEARRQGWLDVGRSLATELFGDPQSASVNSDSEVIDHE